MWKKWFSKNKKTETFDVEEYEESEEYEHERRWRIDFIDAFLNLEDKEAKQDFIISLELGDLDNIEFGLSLVSAALDGFSSKEEILEFSIRSGRKDIMKHIINAGADCSKISEKDLNSHSGLKEEFNSCVSTGLLKNEYTAQKITEKMGKILTKRIEHSHARK